MSDKPKVIRKAATRESFVRREATKDPEHWTPEYRMWMARQMLKSQGVTLSGDKPEPYTP